MKEKEQAFNRSKFIEEKCSNCGKPNLIDRRNKSNDVFCGWCGTEYQRDPITLGLILIEIHNNHHTPRVKEKLGLNK